MDRSLFGGVIIVALLVGVLVGYGIGSISKVVVITQTTTATTAYLITVETRVTQTVTVATNSTITRSSTAIQL